jgi:hypothetical protein
MTKLAPQDRTRLTAELRDVRLLLAENRAILNALAKSLDRRFRHGKSVRKAPRDG